MNPLNPFAISGLLIAASFLPLALLILIKGKNKITFFYALHLLSTGLWGVGSFLIGANIFQMHIDRVWQASYIAVILIPVFFAHVCYELLKKHKFLVIFAYCQAIIFIILTLQGKMLVDFKTHFDSLIYFTGSKYYALSAMSWLTIFIFAGFQVLEVQKTNEAKQRELTLLITTEFVGLLGGATNFLPGFGINIYPYGNFVIPICTLLSAYGILKYQLFEIKFILKKSIIYSVLMFLASLAYLAFINLSQQIVSQLWGYKSLTLSFIAAFMIGIAFFPLHNRIQLLVDKFIFKKTTDEIAHENELLRQEIIKSEKMKGVATLASGMAHEIKNPLTAIKTFSEYLPERLDDKEFLKKFARIVGSEVNRIDGLVNQLLEFAKPSPLQLKKVNINKLLKETLEFMNSRFVQQAVRLQCSFDPAAESPIDADPNKLKQVFLNIILNALEAMKTGGTLFIETGCWTLDAGKKSTSSNVQSPGSNVLTIKISDTGIGIPQMDLTKIFDPFYSTKDNGTGLGLPISHQIVKEHGGNLEIQSEPGKSTTVVLRFPLTNDERKTTNTEI